MLRYLKETQKLGWKEIAAHFPNRTTNACQFRWRRLVSGTLRTSSPAASAAGTAVQGSNTPGAAELLQTAIPEPGSRKWSKDEDGLILARGADLRVEELSLLLPQRNETEIWHRRSELLGSRRQSSHHSQQQQQLHQEQQQYNNQHHQHYNMNYTTMPHQQQLNTQQPHRHASVAYYQQSPPVLSKSKLGSPFEGLRLPPPISQKKSALQLQQHQQLLFQQQQQEGHTQKDYSTGYPMTDHRR